MRVGLVPDVPHDAVARRVEDVVQRDGELDGAEVRRRGGRRSAQPWSRNARSSRATCGRSVRASARRASGESILGSSGSMGAVNGAAGRSSRPVRPAGGRARHSPRARRGLRRAAIPPGASPPRAPARDVGGLVAGRVLARRLAQRVVRSPPRRARRRRPGRRGPRRPRRRASACTSGSGSGPPHAAPSSTAAAMSAPVFLRCMASSASSEQHAARSRRGRSPARRPCRRRRPPPASSTHARPACGKRPRPSTRECRGLQRIAGQERHRLAVLHVAGGLAAPQRVVVHAGEVVVHERIGVDHLDRGRDGVDRRRRRRPRTRPRHRRAAGASACRRRASRSASPRRAGRGPRDRRSGRARPRCAAGARATRPRSRDRHASPARARRASGRPSRGSRPASWASLSAVLAVGQQGRPAAVGRSDSSRGSWPPSMRATSASSSFSAASKLAGVSGVCCHVAGRGCRARLEETKGRAGWGQTAPAAGHTRTACRREATRGRPTKGLEPVDSMAKGFLY